MSSAMDLDSSLDDIIKKRGKSNLRQKKGQFGNKGNGRRNKGTSGAGNKLPVSNQSKAINKSQKNTNSKQRNGQAQKQQRGNQRGNQSRNQQQQNQQQQNPQRNQQRNQQKNQQQNQQRNNQPNNQRNSQPPQTAIDPSTIVITKKVSVRNNNNHNNTRQTEFPQLNGPVTKRGLSIRGASYGSPSSALYGNSANGLSIRGESGPATVLISNLDPGANSDDIRMICAQFGQISHCEVAVDRTGRSFGEAEVEFVQKQSALDCITKLDNEVADGRILRAILRSRPSGVVPGYVNQTLRSVIAPSRSGFTSA